MAQNGGARRGGGRPKGSIGATKRVAALASAAALKAKGKGPTKAKDGISPKDVLLVAMRKAWDKAHALEAEAEKAQKAADAMLIGTEERSEADRAAGQVSLAARTALNLATSLATAAAPYLHPKLANVDSNSSVALTVTIAKF